MVYQREKIDCKNEKFSHKNLYSLFPNVLFLTNNNILITINIYAAEIRLKISCTFTNAAELNVIIATVHIPSNSQSQFQMILIMLSVERRHHRWY